MTTTSPPLNSPLTLASRFTFDPKLNSIVDLIAPDEEIRLGGNESRILAILASKPNEIFTRQDLHEQVWRAQGFEVDDSSLTQAISTLRKQLNDSTKSPEFIKTVPKLGYKLICSVESAEPTESLPESEPVPFQAQDDLPVTEPEKTIAPEIEVRSAATKKSSPPAISVFSIVILAIAIILPAMTWYSTPSPTSSFRTIGEFEGVPVLTPISHPSLERWLIPIEQCVTRYNEVHLEQRKPIKVIATGGQQNALVLNYIHDLTHPEESVTVRIFSSQTDLAKICQ